MEQRLANTWRLSVNEKKFIETALLSDLRVDGRRPFDYRNLTINFGKDDGSSEVQLGQTHVMGFVTAQLVQPYRDRPNEGTLSIYTEFSPMADPSFEPGRPGESAVELGRVIDRGLRESRAVDMESLCVVSGKSVWAIRVDLHILDNGGNLVDAANIAALAALSTFRRPECSLSGDDGQEVIVHPPEVREPLPLIIHHLPIAVTFAFFRSESILVIDPTHCEEAVMGGRMTVTLNANNDVCAIQKAGGEGVLKSVIMQCLRIASVKAGDITTKIKNAVETYSSARQLRKIKRHPSVNLDVGGGAGSLKDSQGISDGEKSINDQESIVSQSGSIKNDESTNQGQLDKRDFDAKNFIGGPSFWDPHSKGVDSNFLKATLASRGNLTAMKKEDMSDEMMSSESMVDEQEAKVGEIQILKLDFEVHRREGSIEAERSITKVRARSRTSAVNGMRFYVLMTSPDTRGDHECKFDNGAFNDFYESEGAFHEFSAPLTPQQNGVVESPTQLGNQGVSGNSFFVIKEPPSPNNSNGCISGPLVDPPVANTCANYGDGTTSVSRVHPHVNNSSNNNTTSSLGSKSFAPSSHMAKDHSFSSIIGDISSGMTTRRKERHNYAKMIANVCYTSQVEPTFVDEALNDEKWILWIFKNKTDEHGVVTRNKAQLVVQGYAQIEGIDFGETFASVACLEAICLSLSFACIRQIKHFQMDITSTNYRRHCTILNKFLALGINVYQNFYLNKMKAEFEMRMVGKLTFFLGFQIQQYHSRIFFCLKAKYARNLITKFKLDKAKSKRTPAAFHLKLSKDDSGEKISVIASCFSSSISKTYLEVCAGHCQWYTFDTSSVLVGFCDADWTRCSDDRKSTSGGCFFLGNNLTTWFSKKQNSVLLSTVEVEYIAAALISPSVVSLRFQLEKLLINWPQLRQWPLHHLLLSLLASIETVQVDYDTDSSNGDDLVVLSKLLNRFQCPGAIVRPSVSKSIPVLLNQPSSPHTSSLATHAENVHVSTTLVSPTIDDLPDLNVVPGDSSMSEVPALYLPSDFACSTLPSDLGFTNPESHVDAWSDFPSV
ncbi:exosome complex component RRP45A-like isoform X1 [Cucumis melo var. makuwa]|uniref:Protein ECERIFERUM 7 n=1 Tax=Cucumis melo var. makuwa TaxID=1194695 RepID=A0A5A7UC75_CUCMM|nr:exosome complex component RRP45A-like isoform X1 [Cucumis melo var. makuwa]